MEKDPMLAGRKPTTKKRQHQHLPTLGNQQKTEGKEVNNDCSNMMRKIMHKEVEKQRRQEMSTLYSSLRSLLPLQYIQGNRAISDQMHQATNYVKHMENNLKDLGIRRDELLNLPISEKGVGSNSTSITNCVTVTCCNDGNIEILISSSCGLKEQEDPFSLSKVMKLLLDYELEVLSCVSTKASDKTLLCRIESQTIDMACIDLPRLQERLSSMINL